MALQTVGVVGAGVMGVGLAQSLAQSRFEVVLIDITEEKLEEALAQIRQNLRMQSFFAKKSEGGAPAESAATVLERITTSLEAAALEKADFVVENVTEKLAVKEKVYREIDPVCPQHCVFAVNTSAISITRIASLTRRPDRVLGMHFMNPVPLKDTVEVIRGHHTSEETLATAEELLARMGKQGIVVNDLPGFVSNRVLMLTINEAVWVVQDQVAEAADVDRLFKTCFGHKMGPLETGDLIGLDTILYTLEVLYDSYNDPKFRPAPLLRKMVDAGLYGRKSGRGFYDYTPNL